MGARGLQAGPRRRAGAAGDAAHGPVLDGQGGLASRGDRCGGILIVKMGVNNGVGCRRIFNSLCFSIGMERAAGNPPRLFVVAETALWPGRLARRRRVSPPPLGTGAAGDNDYDDALCATAV